MKLGQEAVAEQCRAIDGWAVKVGKQKLQPTPPSTAALAAKIEGLCREDLEKAYRDIDGELSPSFQRSHSYCRKPQAKVS